jgi:hypothetical protein
MRISVIPDELAAAGGHLTQAAGAIEAVASQVRVAAYSAEGACGFPEPSAALDAIGDRWGGALSRTATGVNGLGDAVSISGSQYALTDEVSILPR